MHPWNHFIKLYMKIKIIILCLYVSVFSLYISAQNIYEETDKYVLNTKKWPTDITQLTIKLISPFSADADKARAIYSWIAGNITVDIKKYLKGETSSPTMVPGSNTGNDADPDASLNKILKKKKGLPADYANLFLRMCNIAGIKATVVKGTYRMNPRLAGRIIKVSNDYWNAVFIDGKWYIADIFSGSGEIDRTKKKFIRKFRGEFFNIEPETAIMSHFPESDQNQFLYTSVKREDMAKLPVPGYGFLKFGVSDFSPKSGLHESIKQSGLIIKMKFSKSPEKILMLEGSRRTEIKPFKNREGYSFIAIELGKKRNRIITIAATQAEEVFDIITYKIN